MPAAACGGIDFDLQPDLVLLPWAQPDGADFRPLNGEISLCCAGLHECDSFASMRS